MPETRDNRGVVARFLRRLLIDPAVAGLDLDDPYTTELRREVIRRKRFLRQIYLEWYHMAAGETGARAPVVELGSGGGFLKETMPRAITSEVLLLRSVDMLCSAAALPFRDGSIHALLLIDVAHHIPDVRAFLHDAQRALSVGGRIVMIEPWATPWSRFVYRRLHHEPFRPDATAWEFPSTGPLSGANGALPWIIFARDRATFEREMPALRIVSIRPLMPFRYLLSGGVSMRPLVPAWSFGVFRAIENALAPLRSLLAMFALIVVERRRSLEKLQE